MDNIIIMGLIGPSELIVILFAFLIFFGPDKIPEMARSLGKAMGEYKKAQLETENEMKRPDNNSNDKETKIHDLAIEIGLDVQNKTTEQLVEEIRTKIRLDQGLKLKSEGI